MLRVNKSRTTSQELTVEPCTFVLAQRKSILILARSLLYGIPV